jgi:hypothetical protein
MTRPTRPPGPPYPEGEEPPESGQPRFTPHQSGPHNAPTPPHAYPAAPPPYPTPPQSYPAAPPGYQPEPPTQVPGFYATGQQPLPPPPPPAPPRGGGTGPSFTPRPPGGEDRPGPKHGRSRGGRPRPTFTPHEGYVAPGDRARPAPAPTAFLPMVPAGYPQPSFEPFDYADAPAVTVPTVRPDRPRRACAARRPGQPHPRPRAGRGPGRPDRAAAGRRYRAEPRPVEQGDGARHGRVQRDRVPAHARAGDRPRPGDALRGVQQLQHAAEHRVLPDARRHLHLGRGPDAGPGGQGGPGPGRGLRTADLLARRGIPALRHRGGHGALRTDRRPVAGNLTDKPRAPRHGDIRLLLHPADLLLRDGLAARRDPQRARPVRREHVDAGHQQRRGHPRRPLVHGDPTQHQC